MGTATEIIRLTSHHHNTLTSHVHHTAHHSTDLIRDHDGITRNRIQFQGNTFSKEANTTQVEEDTTTAGIIQDDEENTTGEDRRRSRTVISPKREEEIATRNREDRRRINSNRDIGQDRITIPEMTDRLRNSSTLVITPQGLAVQRKVYVANPQQLDPRVLVFYSTPPGNNWWNSNTRNVPANPAQKELNNYGLVKTRPLAEPYNCSRYHGVY
ncbi:hypothetical protein PR048_009588 [Dryococelus australis]|uniref:Uncharacterized protein n=1 Tax=Dryococelus australis TaxID=614101 RepID=A0ABQ9I0B4_9NEOP|nr:hypothetical protein PR048_009588 [Dryococelus australis]